MAAVYGRPMASAADTTGQVHSCRYSLVTLALVQRQPRMYTGNTALFLIEYRSDVCNEESYLELYLKMYRREAAERVGNSTMGNSSYSCC